MSDTDLLDYAGLRYYNSKIQILVKDMLRANVEATTSGRNTVVRDKRGNPHIMCVVPKFRLSDIDSNWASTVHPAFIVNGTEKSEILIGKFLASQNASGKVQTLPHQAPWTQINFDSALAACRELGPNFCLNTNAMWAARVLWGHKLLGGSHEYLGNRNYGRDYTHHELTGVLKSGSYLPGDSSLTDAATLTGTGGPLWNDDGTESGIADLVGNVWEWVGGFRLNNGEIQIIPNNDACLADCDMTTASTEWKAILEDGALVAPETADTLKFDSAYADASGSVGAPSLNTSITNSISTGYNSTNFKSFAAASGITVPAILKQMAIFPVGTDLQGSLQSRNSGERPAARGGYWYTGLGAGPFALHMSYPRPGAGRGVGFRAGFIS